MKEDDDSEAAAFLRGLYGAILTELPKVAVNNDAEILRRAKGYIARLKEIWEETAMREQGLAPAAGKTVAAPAPEAAADGAGIVASGLSVSI